MKKKKLSRLSEALLEMAGDQHRLEPRRIGQRCAGTFFDDRSDWHATVAAPGTACGAS